MEASRLTRFEIPVEELDFLLWLAVGDLDVEELCGLLRFRLLPFGEFCRCGLGVVVVVRFGECLRGLLLERLGVLVLGSGRGSGGLRGVIHMRLLGVGVGFSGGFLHSSVTVSRGGSRRVMGLGRSMSLGGSDLGAPGGCMRSLFQLRNLNEWWFLSYIQLTVFLTVTL